MTINTSWSNLGHTGGALSLSKLCACLSLSVSVSVFLWSWVAYLSVEQLYLCPSNLNAILNWNKIVIFLICDRYEIEFRVEWDWVVLFCNFTGIYLRNPRSSDFFSCSAQRGGVTGDRACWLQRKNRQRDIPLPIFLFHGSQWTKKNTRPSCCRIGVYGRATP